MYAIRYKELVKKDEGINNNMAKKRDKKNKLRGKWLRGIIIVYLLLILCNLFHEFPSRLGNLHSIPVSEEWYLIVVNRWNEIPEDYRVELTELSNGQKVDSRIYPYLQEMFDAARKDGIYPVVRERMEIDASKRLVYRGEKEVNITFTEFEILYLLASSPGRVFSKEQIYELVWEEPYFGDYNIVMSHIRNIREKIEDNPSKPIYIQTVWGGGYRFNKNISSGL